MIKHTPWLDRSFTFNFPVTHFPFFLERLRGTHPRLVDISFQYTDAILSSKVGQAWSIKEHIGHLTDLEELHESRIDDYLRGEAVLHAADMSNKKTNSATHNDRPIAALLADFKGTRNHFVARLSGMNEEQLALAAIHPRLQKPMRLADMAFFVAEHDDHHLTLIRRILDVADFPSR